MQAAKNGEHPLKLEAISSQFIWYRKFGSYTKLFAREPSGKDEISDQYKEDSLFGDSIDVSTYEEDLWVMHQKIVNTSLEPKAEITQQASFWRALPFDVFSSAFIRPLQPGMNNRYPLLAKIPDYIVECDNSPEMAELRREYIFAVGEVIVGFFLLRCGGQPILADGIIRIGIVLNKRVTLFDKAKLENENSIKRISEASKLLKN